MSLTGPRIFLFSYTRDIERVCAAAMRSCYSSLPAFSLFRAKHSRDETEETLTQDRVKELIRKALKAGHLSVLEHGLLTFDLQGVSRALTHQLVRHRIASFSQQSQRHVRIDAESDWYVIPPNLGDESKRRFEERMRAVASWYLEESKSGTRIEDARFYLPNAAKTNIVVSMNPRELLHVFKMRCGAEAQWEIRAVAWAMMACSKIIAPNIFSEPQHLHADTYFAKREETLEDILSHVRTRFENASAGETVEIPLTKLELGFDVRAFVYKP